MVNNNEASQALQDPQVDPSLLARIAYDLPEFGAEIAQHPRAYPGLVAWLSQFGSPEAQEAAALRTANTPSGNAEPDAHHYPSFQPEPQIEEQAAEHNMDHADYQPSEGQLAQHPNPYVAPSVQPSHGFTAEQASNPSTDLMTLAHIAEFAPELRVYLASNPSTYPELLEWLGGLGDVHINAALANRR